MIKFVYQNSPRGTGDAVLKCKNLIKSKYFLMLMPDDLIINSNCSASLVKLHNRYKSPIIASKKVNKKDVSRWGIFDIKKINKKDFIIKDVIEKPSIKSASSNYAVIGCYVLPKIIFRVLKKQRPGQNGEIHITDAIRFLLHKKNKFIGHIFAGKYLDCGTMKGYINSSIEISKVKTNCLSVCRVSTGMINIVWFVSSGTGNFIAHPVSKRTVTTIKFRTVIRTIFSAFIFNFKHIFPPLFLS
jgi:UTP--glucose-1-phosphate uridylyltransferase